MYAQSNGDCHVVRFQGVFEAHNDNVGARIEPGPALNFVSISSEVEHDAPALSSSSNEGRKNVV